MPRGRWPVSSVTRAFTASPRSTTLPPMVLEMPSPIAGRPFRNRRFSAGSFTPRLTVAMFFRRKECSPVSSVITRSSMASRVVTAAEGRMASRVGPARTLPAEVTRFCPSSTWAIRSADSPSWTSLAGRYSMKIASRGTPTSLTLETPGTSTSSFWSSFAYSPISRREYPSPVMA